MSDYTYRLNLYSPADFEAQTRSFEKMAQKGWMLDRYGSLLLRYSRGESADVHYTMTYLGDQPVAGILTSGRELSFRRAEENGWELVCDLPHRPLQVFRSRCTNPKPIEDNDLHRQKQTAQMLRKQHLRQRIVCLLLPLLLLLILSNDGLSPLRMAASEDFFSIYLLLFGMLAYLLFECLWYLLWNIGSKKAAARGGSWPTALSPVRWILCSILAALAAVTLWHLCTGPGWARMTCYLLLSLGITALSMLVYRLLKKIFRNSRMLSAPMFALLLLMLTLFFADVITNLLFQNDSMLVSSEDPPPVTLAELGYTAEDIGSAYVSSSPVADYLIYGRLDAEIDAYLYYEVCTVRSDWLRDLLIRRTAWDYWMEPSPLDPLWEADAAYTTKTGMFNSYCTMVCKDEHIYFLYGWPQPAAQRLLEILTK